VAIKRTVVCAVFLASTAVTSAQSPAPFLCRYPNYETRKDDEPKCLRRLAQVVTRVGDLLKIRLDDGSDKVIVVDDDTFVTAYRPAQRALFVETWSGHHWGTGVVDLRDGTVVGVYLPPKLSPDGRWGFSAGSADGGVLTSHAYEIIDFHAKPFAIAAKGAWNIGGVDMSEAGASWVTSTKTVFRTGEYGPVFGPAQPVAELNLRDGVWVFEPIRWE
jgi:hypothetical protein